MPRGLQPVTRRIESVELGGLRAGGELPVVVLRAESAGPTVAVTANVHGDEVTGLAAVHELDRRLQSELVAGRAVLYPSLNPSGLRRQQRAQPVDGVDMNRVFPGDPEGSGASRLAGRIWHDLARWSPDALLDLHADSTIAIPYAIVDRSVALKGSARRDMEQTTEAMAQATGLTVLREYPDDLYVRFRLDRSLAGAMVNHASVPAITLEVGPRRAVDPRAVEVTVAALMGVLAHLGLVKPSTPRGALPRVEGGPWRRGAAPSAHQPGLFVPALAPGRTFRVGEVLGRVHALDGTVREVITASHNGVVVSWSESAWIDTRGVPGTVGIEEA